jgi:hypothetical protein
VSNAGNNNSKDEKDSQPTEKCAQLPRNIHHRHRVLARVQVRRKVRESVVLFARVREGAAAPRDTVERLCGARIEGDGVEPVAVGFVAEDEEGGC